MNEKFSQYFSFNREEWSRLRLSTPLLLAEEELKKLQGINEEMSIPEVTDIYLPLSRLLNLYVSANRYRQEVAHAFLGTLTTKVPYIIGIAGSVAVGKSTTARVLQALLSRWPTKKIVWYHWNHQGTADGPIETQALKGHLYVDFIWVIYHEKPPVAQYPGTLWIKFGQ